MATLVFFGPLVELTGCRNDEMSGGTLEQIVEGARLRYGEQFASSLASCSIWVDGEPVANDVVVPADAEVAFLPPISGG